MAVIDLVQNCILCRSYVDLYLSKGRSDADLYEINIKFNSMTIG